MRSSTPSLLRFATVVLAVGLVGLALLSFVYRDLLLQWQPAPHDASWRTPVALLSGLVLLVAGLALLVARTRRIGAVVGCAWFALWTIALHGPIVVAMRGSVVSWLGVAEIAAIVIGLGFLCAPPDAVRARRALTIGFGLCAIVFGLSHFVYAEFTAHMVPGWVPLPVAVAWATGFVHVATGVALVTGFVPRAAASVEAAMMSSFVLLLHVPHVVAAPDNRAELTALGIAWTLSAAAWVVAAAATGSRRR